MTMIPWLRSNTAFPPISAALTEPNGLLAVGGELSPDRLIEAYSHGIFPWYAQGQPVLWWSPDPRMVLFVDEFRISRSLRKVIRQARFDVRVDSAFEDVIEACASTARPGQLGTWITPAVIDAYLQLHRAGHAHSVEVFDDGELVGGLYGVSIGRMFFGESMFSRESNASKIALVQLAAMLRTAGFPLIDCQQETAHLSSFGARLISRREFAKRLAPLVNSSAPGSTWTPVPASALLT
jgi:leucyl/phenylalanyl-tRNA---protein transferase